MSCFWHTHSLAQGGAVVAILLVIYLQTYVDAVPVAQQAEKPCTLRWMKQPLNHFNEHDHRVFSQRYYVCGQHFDIQNGPIILFLCGEGVCDPTKVLGTYAESLADSLGGLLISLEHRYYGASLPFHRMGTDELLYLNMEQALADTAAFVRDFSARLTTEGLVPVHLDGGGEAIADRCVPWLLMGGSYGGTLAAWFRMSHPELSAGCIASSAPMYPRVDFPEFDAEVARVLGPTCVARVKKAVDAVEEILAGGGSGARGVKEQFNATMLNDDDFSFMVSDMVAMTTQYGYKEMLCGILEHSPQDTPGLVSALAQHSSGFFFFVLETGGPSDYSSSDVAEELSDSDWGGRQWWWQRCSRLGYFETASPMGVRPVRFSLGFYKAMCSRLFSSAPFPSHAALAKSAPVLLHNATNIVFTNGGEDPWRLTSVTRAVAGNAGVSFAVADCGGCGHTTDLRQPDEANDPAELTVLRAEVEELVHGWLVQHAMTPA